MTVGMFSIWGAAGKFSADNSNDRRNDISEIVDRLKNNGDGISKKADNAFG